MHWHWRRVPVHLVSRSPAAAVRAARSLQRSERRWPLSRWQVGRAVRVRHNNCRAAHCCSRAHSQQQQVFKQKWRRPGRARRLGAHYCRLRSTNTICARGPHLFMHLQLRSLRPAPSRAMHAIFLTAAAARESRRRRGRSPIRAIRLRSALQSRGALRCVACSLPTRH